MAVACQISGKSGTGKSRSIKPLTESFAPNEVFYINADIGKSLPWSGWREFFNKENKNYLVTSDGGVIYNTLQAISEKRPDVKVVIVDTINTIMSVKEMKERRKPGFDKWMELAGDIFDMREITPHLRDDLIIIYMAHIEPYEVDGETHYRTKTNGQKLTKLNIDGLLSYNLYTEIEHDGTDKQGKYYFITQGNGRNEARSPEGVLDYKIPNDLSIVVKAIREKDLGIKDVD